MNHKERRALYARLLADPAVVVLDHRKVNAVIFTGSLEGTAIWVHLMTGAYDSWGRVKTYTAHAHATNHPVTTVTVEFGGLKFGREQLGKLRVYSDIPDKATVLHEVAMGLPNNACEQLVTLLDNFHEYNKP